MKKRGDYVRLFTSEKKMKLMIKEEIKALGTEFITPKNFNDENYTKYLAKAFYFGTDEIIRTYELNQVVTKTNYPNKKKQFWYSRDKDAPAITMGFAKQLCDLKEKIIFCNGIRIGETQEKLEYDVSFTNIMREIVNISGYSGDVAIVFGTDGEYRIYDSLSHKCENEVITTTDEFFHNDVKYRLISEYFYGRNVKKLFKFSGNDKKDKWTEVSLESTDLTRQCIPYFEFSDKVINAVVFNSNSLIEPNIDLLNKYDEAHNNINDINRRCKPISYFPEHMMHKNAQGATISMPSREHSRYFITGRNMNENNGGKIEHVMPEILIESYRFEAEEAKDAILRNVGISKASLGDLDNVANISFESRMLSESSTIRTREQWLNDLLQYINEIYVMWKRSNDLFENKAIGNYENDIIEVLPYISESKTLSQSKALELYTQGIITIDEVRESFGLESIQKDIVKEEKINYDEDDE